MSAQETVADPVNGLLQGNSQRRDDRVSEDTQMPDAPPAPAMPENSDSLSRAEEDQGEDTAHAASEKKAPKVSPEEPFQARNLRRPPKLAVKATKIADQEGLKAMAKIDLEQQLDKERALCRDLSEEVALHKNEKERLQGDAKSFRQLLEKERALNRDLSKEVTLHKNEKERLQGEVRGFRQLLEKERALYRDLSKEVALHKNEKERLQGEVRGVQQQLGDEQHIRRVSESDHTERTSQLLATNKSLSIELNDAKDQISDLQKRLQGQEASVTKAQAAAVNLLSNTVSSTLPDDVIRSKFSEICETLQDWARYYATDASDLPKSDSFSQILVQRQVLGDAKGVPRSLTFDLEDDTAPATLLNAAVTLKACNAFLDNPFFCASMAMPDQQSKSDLDEEDIRDVLERVWRKLAKVNEAEAHSWRAFTVRMFCESTLHRMNFEMYCKKTVEEFCERYVELLDGSSIAEAKTSLRDPMIRLGELALQLWSTKINIRYHHLRHYCNKHFALASEEMQAARVVRLDEYDTALDGRPIQVVLQPMIAAFGTPEGKEYQKRKIWVKAGVWISNKDRPAPVIVMRKPSARVVGRSSGFRGLFYH